MSSPSTIAAKNEILVLGSDLLDVQLDLSQPRNLPANKIALPGLGGSQSAQLLRHAYLCFEHITGHGTPPAYDVYLNLPPAAQAMLKQPAHGDMDTQLESQHFAGTLGFYGLESSSTPGLEHNGSGMNIILDITDLLKGLRNRSDWSEQALHVSLLPREPMTANAAASIGRISLQVVAT
ncbi:hypothetical protein ACO0LF_12975 [Undibacterium sp. Di27W]|uniref:DUF7868 domain-containing protein n=1 Tax=Undibacterium sp. Di27W TaxID=3413036 RepID=UPI003BF36A0C